MTDWLGSGLAHRCSRLGNPEVAVTVDMQAMRPREDLAPEHLRDVAVLVEPDDGIQVGVVTVCLAAERRVVIAAPQRCPETLTVLVHIQTTRGADESPTWQFRPGHSEAARTFSSL